MPIYLIKYTGAIGTKDKRTRWRFTQKLGSNIRKAMRRQLKEVEYKESEVKPLWNHTIVKAPVLVDEVLSQVSGIQYFVNTHHFTLRGLPDLAEKAHEYFRPVVEKAGTFGVRCRKKNQSAFSRKDVEVKVGDQLIQYAPVDLDNPGVKCYVEIRGEDVFLYTEKQPGAKGVPLGVQGKVITMFSGGIDSPVAAWRLYRMGLDQDFVYFDLGGEKQKEQLFEVWKKLVTSWGYGCTSELIYIDLLPIVGEIRQAKKSYQNLLLKYFFYRITATLSEQRQLKGIATGESIGQVSTQTLINLGTLSQVTQQMILRPLLGFSKQEIIDTARQLGTFEKSYTGKEYCALAGKNVVTAAPYDRLMEIVSKLDTSLIDKVIEERVIYRLDGTGSFKKSFPAPKDSSQNIEDSVNTQTESADWASLIEETKQVDKIIDLRASQQYKKGSVKEAQHIPFDKAWKEYINWDKDKSYYLICEVGSRSKMLAHYMNQEGFEVDHLQGGIARFFSSNT